MSRDHGEIPLDVLQEDVPDISPNMWGIGMEKQKLYELRTGTEDLKVAGENKNSPANMLQQASETFKQRFELYGDNYKKFGIVMQALMPKESDVSSIENHNRLGLLTQIIYKLTRYCENFNKGGHKDSIHDLCVYAAMLESLDDEINEVPF
jgi:hypothetical protein